MVYEAEVKEKAFLLELMASAAADRRTVVSVLEQ